MHALISEFTVYKKNAWNEDIMISVFWWLQVGILKNHIQNILKGILEKNYIQNILNETSKVLYKKSSFI